MSSSRCRESPRAGNVSLVFEREFVKIPDVGNRERDLYPVNEVAYRLGITPRKVWLLISDGRIRTKRLDGRRLVPADALAEFIAGLPDGEESKASAA